MQTLTDMIEARATRHLQVEADASQDAVFKRCEQFRRAEFQRLKRLHHEGRGGREVCRAHAAMVDALIRCLWTFARQSLSAQAQREFPPLALVAYGGYGRGELNPRSDIDLMFLHEGQVVAGNKPLPHLSRVMDCLLTPLWDLGFKIGHAVRSVADCVEVANGDMRTKTSLIEARRIIGDARLYERFQKTLLAKCVEGREQAYIEARLRDQANRREKHGNSPTMQEPNLKSGCGGLRDYQNLHWMAYFKYRTRDLGEMEARQLVSPAERRQLEDAYDYLLRVRSELHYLEDRAADVLTRNLQPAVARAFGFTDRSPGRRLQRFMSALYHHTRNISLITRNLEDKLALLPQARLMPALRKLIPARFRPASEQVVDGFRFADGRIHAVYPQVFRDYPRRLMRVFLHAQQRGLQLHPDLAALIRRELGLANQSFLEDEHVRETFLEILNQRGSVAPILRAMHEVGLLGTYLPEFGRLTNLVQLEFYHVYTADEHTLVCLEQLDRIWHAQGPPQDKYCREFQRVERPFVLYLALLLHDAGKARETRRHSEIGGRLAARVAKRFALDSPTTQALRLLVELHLVMTQVSQRRDLQDSGVIRAVAAQVQTLEHLRMLLLHTFADANATSSKMWNGFKDALLWDLFQKTERLLSGATDFLRVEEKRRELLADEAQRGLPASFPEDELRAHFSSLPARYFQSHSAGEIATDLLMAHRFMKQQAGEALEALAPVVEWKDEPDRGYTSGRVCTWDRPGLFSRITGSFSAAGINILGAQVFTRTDGIALDTFFVTDGHTGGPVAVTDRQQFETVLRRALSGQDVDFPALMTRHRSARPLYQSLEDERIQTRLHFDNATSENRTIIDIETEDRLGLLYAISQVFSELGLDISLAKISTEQGAASDSFYVTGAGGSKLQDLAQQKLIGERLRAAIAALDPPAKAKR